MTPGSLRCGIFGGTFDPIHLGHTGAVRQIMTQTDLDEVRVIPAAFPPHREKPCASSCERLDMVKIALAEESNITLDARELERTGQSYTVDTVRELHAEFPNTFFSLILGLDAALELDQWYQWKELLSLVSVVVMMRPGWSLPEPLPCWWHNEGALLNQTSTGRIHMISNIPMDISATRIRADLCHGKDVRHWLHPGVYHYIRQHGLYYSSPELEYPV